MQRLHVAVIMALILVGILMIAWATGLVLEYYTIHNSGSILANAVTASSGSVTDIQSAVNQIESLGGGRVYIPAGNWLFDATPSVMVTIPGGVSVFGAGKFLTNLTLRAGSTYDSTTMFYVDGANQLPVRVSGITFIGRTGAAAADTGDNGVFIDNTKDFRVDHCSFHVMGSCGVAVFNSVISLSCQGVVDHCDFYNIYKPGAETAGTGFGYGVGVERTYSRSDEAKIWAPSLNGILGTYANVTYVEDCYFQGCRHSICAYATGAYVARFNTFTDMHVYYGSGHCDVHGAYPDGVYGGRYMEVYNNTFLNPANDSNYPHMYEYSKALRMRGGGGVFFNNVAVNYAYMVCLSTDDGNPSITKCKVRDLYMWNNVYDGDYIEEESGGHVENSTYFLYPRPSYTPYQYPHPLVTG